MSRLLTALLAAAFAAGPAVAQSAGTRKAFIDNYRCHLAGELQAVFERPSSVKERDQFLVLSVDSTQSYVRCRVGDNRKKIFCETSSLFTAHMPPQAVAALERLGFTSGPTKSNFFYERDLAGAPDFDAIANLMLAVLHDVYGARDDTRFRTVAPFAGTILTVCRH